MLSSIQKFACAAVIAFLCGQFSVNAQSSSTPKTLSVPHMFSDNMVLQQMSVDPIWGWGADGTTVTVKFQDQTVSARVSGGVWMVELKNLKAGGPETLTITSSDGGSITLKNILVGEVWLASGQSNMEFALKGAQGSVEDIAASGNPMIHLLHVPHARLDVPTNDIGATWTECTPDTTPGFSAVAYYFARDLQKSLKVPIGIIESSWGGTPAEVWMKRDFLRSKPEYRASVFGAWVLAQDKYERALASYDKKKAEAAASGASFTNKAPTRPWKPGELYDGMIAPLVGYSMKGALWYQGESNAGSAEDADEYHSLFPDLIRNWRADWNEGPFTFLLVQLAPFLAIQPQPSQSSWASVREAQLKATQILPNVGMAVITDVGDEHNIHPVKKAPVGARLALAAGGIAYHQPIEYSGPVLKETKIEKHQIVLTFDHVAGGLVVHGDELTGFAICGPDQKFVWAKAALRGPDQIMVYSDQVKRPVAVRFGWASYPVVNLWNKAGLPASPFRTDDFSLQ
jgi:sialate O-acetylesterase